MISIFCINYFSILAVRNKKKTAFGSFYRSRVFIYRNAPDKFFNASAEKKEKCMQSKNKCISAACANTHDR